MIIISEINNCNSIILQNWIIAIAITTSSGYSWIRKILGENRSKVLTVLPSTLITKMSNNRDWKYKTWARVNVAYMIVSDSTYQYSYATCIKRWEYSNKKLNIFRYLIPSNIYESSEKFMTIDVHIHRQNKSNRARVLDQQLVDCQGSCTATYAWNPKLHHLPNPIPGQLAFE